jgi:hypothetical protein
MVSALILRRISGFRILNNDETLKILGTVHTGLNAFCIMRWHDCSEMSHIDSIVEHFISNWWCYSLELKKLQEMGYILRGSTSRWGRCWSLHLVSSPFLTLCILYTMRWIVSFFHTIFPPWCSAHWTTWSWIKHFKSMSQIKLFLLWK